MRIETSLECQLSLIHEASRQSEFFLRRNLKLHEFWKKVAKGAALLGREDLSLSIPIKPGEQGEEPHKPLNVIHMRKENR
jgi:hypothetical protein